MTLNNIPNCVLGPDGIPTHIWTKSCGYRPIRGLNRFFLANVLKMIEDAGKSGSKLWTVVDAEIKRQNEGDNPSGEMLDG